MFDFIYGLISVTGAIIWTWIVLYLVWQFIVMIITRVKKAPLIIDITGRWIVVTGCDSGFGKQLVDTLVARNAKVIAFCYTQEGSKAALRAGAMLAPCCDLCNESAVFNAVKEVTLICNGELWGVVHNAGGVAPGFIDFLTMSTYRKVMDINFFAPVQLTQQLLPCLRKSKGRVIVVSSVDGLVSLPGNAPYDASKFAIEAYSDALRTELSFWDVSVSVINPSTMRTPLAMTFFEGYRTSWNEMKQLDPKGIWQELYTKEWLEHYIDKNTNNLHQIAEDPILVVNDMMHALTARCPKIRYFSGNLSKTLFYTLWIIPESWSMRLKCVIIDPKPKVS